MHGEEGLQPLAIGQGKVEQDDIERGLAEPFQSGGKELDVGQLERPVPAVAEQIRA